MTGNSDLHILDQIEVYLADGLSHEERLALESHAANCPTCARALAEAREADARFQSLFQDAMPAGAFEDRIIHRLRIARAPRRTILHPLALRAAAAMAAGVLLVGAGVMVNSRLDHGSGSDLISAISNSRSIQTHLFQMNREMVRDGGWSYGKHDSDSTGTSVAAADSAMRNPVNQRARRLREEVDKKSGTNLALNYALSDSLDTYGFRPGQQLGIIGKPLDSELPGLARQAEGKELPAAGGAFGDRRSAGGGKPTDQKAPSGLTIVAKTQDLAPAVFNAPGPAAPPDPFQAGPKPANPVQTNPAPGARKIIRNGTMSIEVDRFDDALMRITKLVVEQGGFIATTDSDKLPNGKMKGTLTLRVPPEHLDALVLTLRGIGDLKSQKIGAEDVTRHYTDLESGLRAARAMEERLLDIIKTGKGQIKDLLAAEKELGVWREKIEQIEGEKRFMDNLISLSTLTIELYERDIHTPASASETEQVQMSLETEKVDEAYEKARAAIESARGRIVQAELKQYDAGQFGATIQAAIPPDGAEQVVARLRQLPGRIAHFSRDSRRTTANGEAPQAGVTTVHREDVIVSMQIYNLANVSPRRTTTLQLAAANVDRAYQQVLDQVRSAGGRVVTSSLSKPDAAQQAAEIDIQIPTEKADVVQDAVRTLGDIMRQDATESPDTVNVTEAKRGLHVRIVSLAAVPARESQDVKLAAGNVHEAFNDILAAVNSAGGRVLESGLNEQDLNDVTALISFELPRSAAAAVDRSLGKAGQVLSRTLSRSPDAQNTLDSKIRVSLAMTSGDRLPPRQTTTIREEVSDVERAVDDIVNAAASAGGRRIGSGEMTQDRAGHSTAQVVVDVPLAKAGPILDQVERMGYRRSRQVSFDNTVPEGPLARARIDVTFSNSAESLGGEQSTWDAIRHALSVTGTGLRWSLQMLVIGICFVAPWALVLWGVWRLVRRRPSAARATSP